MRSMTIKNKITLLYLATYGSVVFALSITLFMIFRTLEYRRIDGLLLSFHNDIVNTYKYAGEGEKRLLSLAGDENLGFALYAGEKPLASFRIEPGTLSSVGPGMGTAGDYRYRATLENIEGGDRKVVTFYRLEGTRAHLNNLLLIIILSAAFTLLLVSLVGMAFTRKLMKPLEQAGNQLERISRSEIGGARVEVENTGREIEKLQLEINRALDRIERLVEDTRQMSSKIAHELRTPLAVMKTNLQLSLEKNSSPGEMRLSLKDTMKELDKLIRMSEGFLLLSRIESAVPLEMARVDLSGLLLETIEKIMILYPGVEFALDVAPAIEMRGVSHMIEHAIINLLDNAARYTTDGSVSVRLSTGERYIVLEVTNRGRKVEMERPGMLSGSSVAAGNGIGLTVVQAVTKLHKADLLYEHRDGTNRFMIRFPA